MADSKDIKKGKLVGYGFYVFNRKPQHDKDNDKFLFKIDLRLTEADGSPVVRKSKLTGVEVNMLEEAKRLGLIIKEPNNTIDGQYVRIKREVKVKQDGTKTQAPDTKTPTGEDFSEIIGNGSEVSVSFGAIPISKGKYMANSTAYLNKITVLNHVPYIGNMDEEYEFGSSTPAKTTTKAVSKPAKVEVDADDSDEEFAD